MIACPPMLLGLCLPLLAPALDGPVIILPEAATGAAALPQTVTFDPVDVARAAGMEGVEFSHPGVVAADGGAVLSQVTAHPEGTVTVAFVPLPGVYRYLLTPTAPAAEPVYLADAVTVEETDESIVVSNAYYRVTHPKRENGGLPSVIEFIDSGKRLDAFLINDRVYSATSGGHLLREDPAPEVRVLGEGPLAAVVEVQSRYGGGGAPGAPRATYRFHYFRGTPGIAVEADVTQAGSTSWAELHLLEVNDQSGAFTGWVGGGTDQEGELTASGQSYAGNPWGAIIDGPNVLGIVCPGGVRIHDGHGEYGTYVHGPWVSWSGAKERLNATLWVSAAEGALGDLAAAAASTATVARTSLVTTLIEGLEARLAASGDQGRMAAAMAGRMAGPSLSNRRELLEASVAALAQGGDPRQPLLTGGSRVLEAGDLALVVADTGDGLALASLFDQAVGREMASTSQPLWSASVRLASEELVEVRSDAGFEATKVSVAGGTAQLEWSGHEMGIEARMEVRLADSRVSTRLSIDMPGSAALMSVVPLNLRLGPLGETGADDALLYPMVSGGLVTDPITQGVSHVGQYPSGWTCIPMGAYYDPEGGLYAAWHDPLAGTKDVLVQAGSGEARIQFTYPAEDAGVLGNGFRQPGEMVVHLMRGDWYDAARIYRAWASTESAWWPDEAQRRTPEWMKEVAVWANASGGPEDVVDAVSEFAEYMGVPTAVHWYNWHQIPFDVEYPHYFPTKPGVAEGVAELQAAGVRVMPYINGRLWDTALEDFKSSGIAAATKDEEGAYYTEEYGSGAVLAPMCPTQELWRGIVTDTVLRLCDEVGVDGVYIDQVAAASPRLCFDATHGHPLCGGSWWTDGGYWPMLTRLRERLRALPGEKMITTECNAEPYTHLFDGYLTWHFQYHHQIPLFAAVYGGQVQLFGRSFGGDSMAQRLKAAEALVWGEQLGWAPCGIIHDPLAGPMLRRCARLRHALQPFLAVGEMAHPPTIVGEIPEVTSDWQWSGTWIRTDKVLQCGAWRDGNGRLAVIFANVSEEPLRFTWAWDGAYLRPSGKSEIVTEDGVAPGPSFTTSGRLPISLAPLEVRAYVVDEG